MDIEYIYIFTNPAMPAWVKVGKTKNIKNRINGLSKKTGVPLPFECYAYMEVPSDLVFVAEGTLHSYLGQANQQQKEFFQTTPEIAYKAFQKLAPNNPAYNLSPVHPDIETKTEKRKASATTFEMLGIPVGSILTFYRDTSVVCTVSDSLNQVTFQGQRYSLSALACELLHYSVNGYRVFMFEGETLWQRRLRMN